MKMNIEIEPPRANRVDDQYRRMPGRKAILRWSGAAYIACLTAAGLGGLLPTYRSWVEVGGLVAALLVALVPGVVAGAMYIGAAKRAALVMHLTSQDRTETQSPGRVATRSAQSRAADFLSVNPLDAESVRSMLEKLMEAEQASSKAERRRPRKPV